MVPGLGLDARSSARVRNRVQADVALLPGMGLAEPVPAVDVLAAPLVVAQWWRTGPRAMRALWRGGSHGAGSSRSRGAAHMTVHTHPDAVAAILLTVSGGP
jgi:hypothetical protein